VAANGAKMTDTEIIEGVLIEVCELGHVHLCFATTSDELIEGIFTPKEAFELCDRLVLAACAAARKAKEARAAGGDAGPCTRH